MASPKSAPSPVMSAESKKWQAEDDLRTLERACEVVNDPARLKAAKALSKNKVKALEKIEDLEGLRREKY